MKKRMLYVGMFLLATLIFMGLMGAVQAGIIVDDGTRTITLTAGHYDISRINNTVNDNAKLWNQSNGVWLSNYSLIVNVDAVLELNPNATGNVGCIWLKMNNYTNVTWTAHINVTDTGGGTNGGILWVNDTLITGWNETAGVNTSYVNLTNLRSWIFIQGGYENNNTQAYFLNSTLGYLGYNHSERYGIVYRDSNESGLNIHYYPRGWMHNCTVLENYIGIAFQGVPDMNVTDSYFNDSKEVGIVYTVGTNYSGASPFYSADNGYVGDVKSLPNASAVWDGQYDGVTVRHINGTTDPDGCDGIRLFLSDNITFDNVDIVNCTNMGLRVTRCRGLAVNNTLSYLNTDAADNANIYLINITECRFTNSTAHTPNGTVDGINWYIGGTNSSYNNFTGCRGYGAPSQADFEINTQGTINLFTRCTANNSDNGFLSYGTTNFFINCTSHHQSTAGFYGYSDNNETFVNCIGHNNTYDFKFLSSVYNDIVRGYANDSTIGVYIIDISDAQKSHHNNVTNLRINRQTSYAISIGSDGGADNWCYNNTVYDAVIIGTTTGDGVFLFDNVTNNVVVDSTVYGCTHANADGMGFANDVYNNTFVRCNSSNNGDAGFSIIENANNNTIDNCTGYGNSDGMELYGNNSKNNTILYSIFRNNDWGVYMWPGAASSCSNNTFIYCSIHNNTQTGVDYGRAPRNHFRYCTIKDNDASGVEVRQSGNIDFYKCIVWNPSATLYDWIFENTTTVRVLGDYILGYVRNCNNQTAGSPYGNVSHAPGDGAWDLDTARMTVYTSAAPDYCVINMTGWTGATYRRWIGTSNSCSNLYQIIGGLSIGTKYDLLVDGSVLRTVTAFSSIAIIPGAGATGCVWFNYSGPWSTHTFEVRQHAEGPGPAPGPGPVPSDENDIYVYVLTNGEDAIVGASVYIYENSVIVKTGTTDTDGLYETTLDDGTYKFVAKAEGYKEEYKVEAIRSDTTVTFHLTPLGMCPACLAGAYISMSILGWILVAVLVIIGFLLAYLIDSKQIKKDYVFIVFIPNAVLVILGIICHPLLIIIGVACAIIQYLWASREEL